MAKIAVQAKNRECMGSLKTKIPQVKLTNTIIEDALKTNRNRVQQEVRIG
jgi:peptidyl-tRNA hydrolase